MNRSSSFAVEVPDPLLLAAQGGDLGALEQLYRLFEQPAFALAMRLLGHREDARDVLQEALIKVFKNLHAFRGQAPFASWVRQITANEALMRLRRREPMPSLHELPDAVLDDAQVELPIQVAAQAQLLAAMESLPGVTRAVLWLFHAEGFTHEEIAGSMGRSVSFSKSQLARGTRRLRQLMELEVMETNDA